MICGRAFSCRHIALASVILTSQVFLTPALAQESARAEIGNPAFHAMGLTTVTLRPSTVAGAVAEIVFDNHDVNGSDDDGVYSLVTDRVAADVTFTWTNDADLIAVTVPEGFIAHPPTLTLPEGASGVILIYSGEDVGM